MEKSREIRQELTSKDEVEDERSSNCGRNSLPSAKQARDGLEVWLYTVQPAPQRQALIYPMQGRQSR